MNAAFAREESQNKAGIPTVSVAEPVTVRMKYDAFAVELAVKSVVKLVALGKVLLHHDAFCVELTQLAR